MPGAVKPIPLMLDKALVLKRLGRLEAADGAMLEMTLRTILTAT